MRGVYAHRHTGMHVDVCNVIIAEILYMHVIRIHVVIMEMSTHYISAMVVVVMVPYGGRYDNIKCNRRSF